VRPEEFLFDHSNRAFIEMPRSDSGDGALLR
jgi:hypothetical protein